MKFDFRIVKKETIKDKIESVILDIPSRQAFDQKIRELRENNYVLEYQAAK